MNGQKKNYYAMRAASFLLAGMLMMGAEADCNSEMEDIVIPPPPATVTGKVTLYSLGIGAELTAYEGAELLNSNVVEPSQRLTDSQHTVDGARGFALDARGALYVCGGSDGTIAVYEDPKTAAGQRSPDRRVIPSPLNAAHISDIAIDAERDELYLVDNYHTIFVFDIAPDAAFDGEVEPTREFTIDTDYFTPQEVEFSNGSLYVTDARVTYNIFAFDDPSRLAGVVNPDRTFTHDDIELDVGMHVDAADRLIIANRDFDTIMIWNDAKQLDGSTAPDLEFMIDGVIGEQSLEHAVTDSEGRLYVLDNGQQAVYTFDDVDALADGPNRPQREFNVDTAGSGRLLVLE